MPLWSPSPERIERARLTRFMQFVKERHQAPVLDYKTLHAWSVEYPENFWSAIWDFFEVRATVEPNAEAMLLHGRAGRIRFDLESQPLLEQWVRRFRRLLQNWYGI